MRCCCGAKLRRQCIPRSWLRNCRRPQRVSVLSASIGHSRRGTVRYRLRQTRAGVVQRGAERGRHWGVGKKNNGRGPHIGTQRQETFLQLHVETYQASTNLYYTYYFFFAQGTSRPRAPRHTSHWRTITCSNKTPRSFLCPSPLSHFRFA